MSRYDYDDERPVRSSGNRSAGSRASQTRSSGSRPSSSRQATGRTSASRPSGSRQTGNRSAAEGRSSAISYTVEFDEDMTRARRRPEGSHQGSRPSGSHQGSRPAGSRPSGSRQGARPSASHASGSRPSGGRPSSGGRGGNGGRRGSAKKRKKRIILVVEIMIVILLLIILAAWRMLSKVNWDTSINMDQIQVNALDEETQKVLDNYTTIALFGVDNRSNGNYDGGNSDSMMLVSINNDTKEVNVVSVMRDTLLEVSDDEYRKCNYAYNHGGAEQAIEMLNKNFDLEISGYVAVDFMALATIVDDLGGIEVEITQSMVDAVNPKTGGPALAGYIAEVQTVIGEVNEDEWYLKAGTQTLNGSQIVGYCRNRYSGGDDYSRTERQREVVKKIVEKTMSSDVATITKVASDVFPAVSTSLSLAQVTAMATGAADYSINQMSGFPFDLTTGTFGKKGSLVVPCTLSDNVTKLHQFLYDQEDYDTTETVDEISDWIVNYTGKNASSATVNQTTD